MNLIENISYNIANKIGENSKKSKEDIEIINYGIFVMVHTMIAITVTILLGIIIGKSIEVIVITFISATLKRYSGGAHATSPNRCLIIGSIITIIFACISTYVSDFDNIKIIILSTIVLPSTYYNFYKKSPVGSENKPLKSKATRLKLRKKLFLILNIYCIIILGIIISSSVFGEKYMKYAILIQCGILLQSISITKLGEMTISKLDSFLIKLNCKGD